jgi:hypothetical protein
MPSGIDGFKVDLAQLGVYMADRVPVYHRLLALIGEALDGDIGRRLTKAWARRSFTAFYDRPLLLLAAIRFDALREGPGHPLWAAVAADPPDPAAASAGALAAALDRDPQRAPVWHSLTRRSLQTNEVSRAVAWMWPASLLAPAGAPLALCDLGASAGLNLVADAPGVAPGWTAGGGPLEVAAVGARVRRRIGMDRAPLDVTREEDADWLRACVWPGERERQERLERAIAAFRSASAGPVPPVLETVEASDMPRRLAELSRGQGPEFWLGYQTVVREYLGASREAYLSGMRDWLAGAPRGRALWVELESPPDRATRERPAALIGHARDAAGAVVDAVIARCEYHPVDLAPEPDGLAALAAALAA